MRPIPELQELALQAKATGDYTALGDALLEDGLVIGEHVRSPDDLRIAARRWAVQYADRRTGRTTSTVDAAVCAALAGETVAVLVGYGERERDRVDELARSMIGERLQEVRYGDAPDLVWQRVFVETAETAVRHLRGRCIDRVWHDHSYFDDDSVPPWVKEDAYWAVDIALQLGRRASRRQGNGQENG